MLLIEIGLAICFIVISLVLLKKHYSSFILVAISFVYVIAVIYLTFFSREQSPYFQYSIKLFRAAQRGIDFGGDVLHGLLTDSIVIRDPRILRGIILNILLFVPYGYLLSSLFTRLHGWQVVMTGFLFSLLIEMAQLITRLGYADVDDLINNTIGTAVGCLLHSVILKEK